MGFGKEPKGSFAAPYVRVFSGSLTPAADGSFSVTLPESYTDNYVIDWKVSEGVVIHITTKTLSSFSGYAKIVTGLTSGTVAAHSHTMPKASVTSGLAALTADLGHNNTTGALETTAATSVGVTLPTSNTANAHSHSVDAAAWSAASITWVTIGV